MRGSSPFNGVNENGGPDGSAPYVSPRGYIYEGLRGAGYQITPVGNASAFQPTRNNSNSEAAAQGGATLLTYMQPANSIEAQVRALALTQPTLHVAFVEGGTNNFNYDVSGASNQADWTTLINLIRTTWPGIIVVQIGLVEFYNMSPSQVAPARQALAALTDGVNVVDAAAWRLNLDMRPGYGTSIDGYHLTAQGARDVGDNAVAKFVASRV